jgi:hypothetical protein
LEFRERGRLAGDRWVSGVANPLDVFTREFLDLLSDLGYESVGVVAGGVPVEPDLPARHLTGEGHLAATERQPQITRAINAHSAVTAGFEDVQKTRGGAGDFMGLLYRSPVVARYVATQAASVRRCHVSRGKEAVSW